MKAKGDTNNMSCEVQYFFSYWLGGKVYSSERASLPKNLNHFSFINPSTTPISGMVDSHFIKTALIGQWYFKPCNGKLKNGSHCDICKDYDLSQDVEVFEVFKEDNDKTGKRDIEIKSSGKDTETAEKPEKLPERILLPIKIKVSKDQFLEKGPAQKAILVRLFSIGVLSITIRWRISCSCNQSTNSLGQILKDLEYAADLVKRPEWTNDAIRSKDPAIQQMCGCLNRYTAMYANKIANLFIREISNSVSNEAKLEIAWLDEVDKNELLHKRNLFGPERIQFSKGLKGPWAVPYLGFVIPRLPTGMDVQNLMNISNNTKHKQYANANNFASLLITIFSTSPSFMKKGCVKPLSYVLESNIARGNAIIIVDRRCILTAGLSPESKEVVNILATLAFAFECVFAATESVKRFLTALDARIPLVNYEFNELLAKGPPKVRKIEKIQTKLAEFVNIVSAARAISPCEDRITQVECYLRSRTTITATKKLKELLVSDLIELARTKMNTYSRILITGYDIVSSQEQAHINKKLYWLTCIIAFLTVVMLFDVHWLAGIIGTIIIETSEKVFLWLHNLVCRLS